MNKIKSVDELLALRERVKAQVKVREQGEHIEDLTSVTVFMGNSGYKAGAKDIFHYFTDRLSQLEMDEVVVFQADSSGLSMFEPLVGVSLSGKEQVLFGKVTKEKVDEIIEQYIKNGQKIDGILSLTATR